VMAGVWQSEGRVRPNPTEHQQALCISLFLIVCLTF
jgi:hypothetical protein